MHVHPKLSDHTAAFWTGNAKAEVLNGAPALQTPSASKFQQADAKTHRIPMKKGKKKNQFTKRKENRLNRGYITLSKME